MSWSTRSIVQCVLATAAIASIAIGLQYMRRSGCAGDLKTGSLGDMTLAAALNLRGIAWGAAGICLLASFAASLMRQGIASRLVLAIGALLLGQLAFTAASFDIATKAIKSCL